jgi:hypothetical protein
MYLLLTEFAAAGGGNSYAGRYLRADLKKGSLPRKEARKEKEKNE